MSQQKHALTVIAGSKIPSLVEISNLQGVTIQQLTLIRQLESESAIRAILVGIALHRIKVSLKHGEFGPWIVANVEGTKKSQINYYMRLASAFVERSRTSKVELLAISGEGAHFVLSPSDADARRFMEKATRFVGECSLNELLVKYGIKGVTREGDDPADSGLEKPVAAVDQLFFTEIAQHLYGFRQSVLKAENIMRLPPDKLREVMAEHDAQNAELHALYEKTKS